MNLLWAPGQGEATREICRHLSGKEKARLYFLAFLFGLCSFAVPCLFMLSVLGFGPLFGPFYGFPAGPGFALLLLSFLALGAWFIIRLQRRLLLSTRFARSNGITMADITAGRPLSRGDYVIVGGTTMLALMIGLAYILMASGM